MQRVGSDADRPSSSPRLRSDYEILRRWYHDPRPPERLVAHYELERRLAERLRHSSRAERTRLYAELNEELFAALPDHPQRTADRTQASSAFASELRLVMRFLAADSTYLDVGCGDAAIPFAVAPRVARSLGLDVTDKLIDHAAAPPNFRFVPTSGWEIPLPDGSVDFAYSNQLMEHLHVEDAMDQLRELFRVLKPGGRYLCRTPSRLNGPHDISCYFDTVATGFHMREYDGRALDLLFRETGFRRTRFLLVVHNRVVGSMPRTLQYAAERLTESLPSALRSRLPTMRVLQPLLGVNLLATK